MPTEIPWTRSTPGTGDDVDGGGRGGLNLWGRWSPAQWAAASAPRRMFRPPPLPKETMR
jgi:hypothetical protein